MLARLLRTRYAAVIGVSAHGNANLRHILTVAGYLPTRPSVTPIKPTIVVVGSKDISEDELLTLAEMRRRVAAGTTKVALIITEERFIEEMSAYDPEFDDWARGLYRRP